MKRCLSEEECNNLCKEHPQPDTVHCVAPKVDKYMVDFLGKCLPTGVDSNITKSNHQYWLSCAL